MKLSRVALSTSHSIACGEAWRELFPSFLQLQLAGSGGLTTVKAPIVFQTHFGVVAERRRGPSPFEARGIVISVFVINVRVRIQQVELRWCWGYTRLGRKKYKGDEAGWQPRITRRWLRHSRSWIPS